MKRLITAVALAIPLLVGCSVHVNLNDYGCKYTKDLSHDLNVEAVTKLVVNARSGDLTIRGHEGRTTAQVAGRACASKPDLLEQMALKAAKSGETIQVDVLYPQNIVNASAWMDLTIDVPAEVAARVQGGSGTTLINRLAELELDKGSGDVDIATINGDLKLKKGSGRTALEGIAGESTLESGSGDLIMRELKGAVLVREKASGSFRAERLGGDLTIHKLGSGDLTLQEIGGNVRIDEKSSGTFRISQLSQALTIGEMGSGSLQIQGVDGPVSIESKASGAVEISDVEGSVHLIYSGSGDLAVRNVTGDLIIKSKGSGALQHSGVEGRVEIPKR